MKAAVRPFKFSRMIWLAKLCNQQTPTII